MNAPHLPVHTDKLNTSNSIIRRHIKYGAKSNIALPASIDSTVIEHWAKVLHRYLSRYLTNSNKDKVRIKLLHLLEGIDPTIASKLTFRSITIDFICDPPIFALLYTVCKNDLLSFISGQLSATIVIPTYNRDTQLDSCIRHLASLQLDFLKIAVVDNDSSDNTCNVVDRVRADYCNLEISYQKNTTNIGWLRNYFVALATNINDIVILGSDDDLFSEEMLAYAAFFYITNHRYGFISFNGTESRHELPFKKSFILSEPTSSNALETLKHINAVGGITLSRDAVVQCLSGFGTDLNLISHIEFCLNISLSFPIASFSCDEFRPKINAFSKIKNSSGISTNPHDIQYLLEMLRSNILDHKFCLDSFNRTAMGYMVYAASSKLSEGESVLPNLSWLFFDFSSRWMNAWLGHRLRDFSRQAPIEDILMMILRLTDQKYIYNIDLILHMSFAIDIRARELEPALRNLYSLLVVSVIKAKILFLHSQGCSSILGLAIPELTSILARAAKQVTKKRLTFYQGIDLFRESISPYHYLALNTHEQEWHFNRSFQLRAPTIRDRLSEGFTMQLSDLFSKFSSQSLGDLDLLVESSGDHQALRFREALNDADLLILIDKVINEIKYVISDLIDANS